MDDLVEVGRFVMVALFIGFLPGMAIIALTHLLLTKILRVLVWPLAIVSTLVSIYCIYTGLFSGSISGPSAPLGSIQAWLEIIIMCGSLYTTPYLFWRCKREISSDAV